jgi:hypothetical protein
MVFWQDAEKVALLTRPTLARRDAPCPERRSRFAPILNGDPAASPLGGAHRLGAPYSSHRAPLRVRFWSSLTAALLDGIFEHPAGMPEVRRPGLSCEKPGLPC